MKALQSFATREPPVQLQRVTSQVIWVICPVPPWSQDFQLSQLQFPFHSLFKGMVVLLQHNNSTAAHSNWLVQLLQQTAAIITVGNKFRTQYITRAPLLMPTAQISSPEELWCSSQSWSSPLSSFYIMKNLLLQCRKCLHSTCEIRDSESSGADCSGLLVSDMSLALWWNAVPSYSYITQITNNSHIQETGGDIQVSEGREGQVSQLGGRVEGCRCM